MPLFSVIIPVFNRVSLLAETLASVMRQREGDFEVVVVDDGSSEDVAEVTGVYGDRVRLLRQNNAGQAAARNLGIAEARGEYLAFLDSDDLWFPWTLENYRRGIEREGAGVLMGEAMRFVDPLELEKVEGGEPELRVAEHLAASQLATPGFVGAGGLVVQRSEADRVGGFPEGRFNGEDLDLLLRLAASGPCVRVRNPPSFGYRTHPEQDTRDDLRTGEGVAILLRREREGAYAVSDHARQPRRRLLANVARAQSARLVRGGHPAAALWLYRRALGLQTSQCRFKYLAWLPTVAAAVAIGVPPGRVVKIQHWDE